MFFYPVDIIPKSNFKYLKFDKLNRLPNIYIVRRSECQSYSETFVNGLVLQKAILGLRGYKALSGLSMNLLGGKFKSKHIKYLQKGIASKDWEPGKKVEYKTCLSDVIKLDIYIPIYISLDKLHNVCIPYVRKNNSDVKNMMVDAFKSAYTNKPILKLNGKIRLEHKPINLNYWHIELKLDEDPNLGTKPVRISSSSGDPIQPISEQSIGVQFSTHILEQALLSNSKSTLNHNFKKISSKLRRKLY